MAIENLTIVQHRDIMRYAHIIMVVTNLNFDIVYDMMHLQPWMLEYGSPF